MIPSSGAPVAGGVLFVPVLVANGMAPLDAVAFTTAAQAIGVGVLTPVNWYITDPQAIDFALIQRMFAPCATAYVIALVTRPSIAALDMIILSIFVVFSAIVIAYTIHVILVASQPMRCPPSEEIPRQTNWVWLLMLIPASVITAYIGVCVDKLLFVLMTFGSGAPVIRSTLTGTTFVGWLSIIGVIVHVFVPDSISTERHMGDIPTMHVMAAVPGLIAGSMCGIHLNRAIGVRNVLIGFVILQATSTVIAVVMALR